MELLSTTIQSMITPKNLTTSIELFILLHKEFIDPWCFLILFGKVNLKQCL